MRAGLLRGVLCYVIHCLMRGVESVGTVLKRANDFCAQPMVAWAYDQMPRRLGAGGALTVLRFAPLARLRPVPGYNAFWSVFQVHAHRGAFCRASSSKA
jgi:hypothetical protein